MRESGARRMLAIPVLTLFPLLLSAQTPDNVLLVVNQSDSLSRRIGEYYVHKRAIPLANVCRIRTTPVEEVSWDVYVNQIERPVGAFLRAGKLTEKILYIVTTLGVPLRIRGSLPAGPGTDAAAVDSELALLYGKLKGTTVQRPGSVPNPFFGQSREAFRHPRFAIYLVTRLAAYDFADVQGMIDRALDARNRGMYVLDLRSPQSETGNDWLRDAARLLPAGRVVLDETTNVVYDQKNVIGYASWGSNDHHRTRRFLKFQWLPGAIITEYVSTNGRTFKRPPDSWNSGNDWRNPAALWEGSPQTLAADYIHEGATGASGHVYEPYLALTPRPEYLFPAYNGGRTLAESYYLAIPALSWQNIVLGDPLCKLR